MENIKKLSLGYIRLPQKDGGFDIALLNEMADEYLAAAFLQKYVDTLSELRYNLY